jgi:hypothetical protein
MWFCEHALLSTAVFGFNPVGYLGSLLPDSFTGLKWLNNLPTGVTNVKNFIHDPKAFKKITVAGKFADLSQMAHSVFVLITMIALGLYARAHGLMNVSVFAAAWSLHVISDYLTHKGEIHPLFPLNKMWKFPFSIDLHDYSNFSLVFVMDFLLLILAILKIVR